MAMISEIIIFVDGLCMFIYLYIRVTCFGTSTKFEDSVCEAETGK